MTERLLRIAGVACALTLSLVCAVGCGGGGSDDDASEAVAARIGDSQITVDQLDREVAKIHKIIRKHPEIRRSRRDILRQMIINEWHRLYSLDRGFTPPANASDDQKRALVFEDLYRRTPSAKHITVSPLEMREYYIAHRAEFAQVAQTIVLVAPARTRRLIVQERNALESGTRWDEAILKYGDGVPNVTGDKSGLATIVHGKTDIPKALEAAIFKAKPQVLSQPIKADSAWYVFSVQERTPAAQPSFRGARKTIRSTLVQQKYVAQFQIFLSQLAARYRLRTVCRPELAVSECRNGSKTKT